MSLTSAAKGHHRFYGCYSAVISPSLSMTHIFGSTLVLKNASLSTPPPLDLAPLPFPSGFIRPSTLGPGRSTHLGFKVNHSPLSTFFCSPPNSARSPDSTIICSSCCRSVETTKHVCGFYPSYPPRREDALPCRSKRSI